MLEIFKNKTNISQVDSHERKSKHYKFNILKDRINNRLLFIIIYSLFNILKDRINNRLFNILKDGINNRLFIIKYSLLTYLLITHINLNLYVLLPLLPIICCIFYYISIFLRYSNIGVYFMFISHPRPHGFNNIPLQSGV